MAGLMATQPFVNSLAGALKTLFKESSRKHKIHEVKEMNICKHCNYHWNYLAETCPSCLRPVAAEPVAVAEPAPVSIVPPMPDAPPAPTHTLVGQDSLAIVDIEEAPDPGADEPCIKAPQTYAEKMQQKTTLESEIDELKVKLKPLLSDIARVANRAEENGYACTLECISRMVEEAITTDCAIRKKTDELDTITCPQCKIGYEACDKFCGYCGGLLGETGWPCSFCSVRNKDENEYCRFCGLKPPPPIEKCTNLRCGKERPECGDGAFCKLCGERIEWLFKKNKTAGLCHAPRKFLKKLD